MPNFNAQMLYAEQQKKPCKSISAQAACKMLMKSTPYFQIVILEVDRLICSQKCLLTLLIGHNCRLVSGRPDMTSRFRGQFLTPIVTLFSNKDNILSSQNPRTPSHYDRNVI